MSTPAGWSVRIAEMKLIPCPLCGGDRFELLALTDRYRHGLSTVGCRGCGLAMTNPQPTAASLDQFYARHYRHYYQKVDKPDLAYIRKLRKDERAAETAQFLQARGALPAGARALDIGASEGCILKALRDQVADIQAYAIEPNPEFGAFAQSHAGCTVFTDLARLPPELRFDLVVINHVYEHMAQPVSYLAALRQRLSERGRVYIDVPDISAYDGIGALHIAHLYHFSPETLARAAAAAGFEVLHLERHAPLMHPRSVRMLLRAGAAAPLAAYDWESDWERIRNIQRTAGETPAAKGRSLPEHPDPVLVVVSYYDRHSPQNLQRLLDSMERHEAGAAYDIAIVANRTSDTPLKLDLKSRHPIRVHERENLGMNIGAWDHGWRTETGYRHYLFLQDECYVVRKDWLKAFVTLARSPKSGLLGESLNPAWDREWDALKIAHASALLPDHTINSKPAPRVDVYLDFLNHQGIDPGKSGRHLRSLIWFAQRELLEAINGFPIGANYGECIAAEIGVSRKVESLGLRALQVASEPFRFIRHLEYNRDNPLVPHTHKAVQRAPSPHPGPRIRADIDAAILGDINAAIATDINDAAVDAPPWGDTPDQAGRYWDAAMANLRLRDEHIEALERKLARLERWQRFAERLRHPFGR